MKRVAVLGGGISGIAAAQRLAKQEGMSVTLFEASDRLGGVLETVRTGPYMIERSADNFATLIPDALELTRECGLESMMIQPRAEGRQAFVLNRGRVLPIPAGFSLMQPTRVGSVLATRTLSWSAKLRLLGEFWVPKRSSGEDESLQSFATRRLGREAFENLVEPIVSGIFTADPSTLSMAATMPQFVEMERRSGGLIRGHLASVKKDAAAAARRASGARYDQFMAPKDGMTSWINALADTLPPGTVQLQTAVTDLKWISPNSEPARQPIPQSETVESKNSAGYWQVETVDHESHQFDGIICALPARHAAGVLGDAAPEVAQILAGIQYASSAVVAMIVKKSELEGRIDGFGLIVPRKEGRQSLAISYTSNKYPGRVPEDELLLRIFLGGALRPDVVDFDDRKLLSLAEKELREILGWNGKKANWQSVIRWKHAMPQYLVGHMDRMRQLSEAQDKLPGLQICGAAYFGVGIPQCVRGGRKAADELLKKLETSSISLQPSS